MDQETAEDGPEPSAQAGMTLGGLSLVECIGMGGMGEVWSAQNTKARSIWRAVKIIHQSLAQAPGFATRFLREAETLELLRHKHILRVDNLGEEDGWLYMIMELLDGRSVETIARSQKGLVVPAAADLLCQALEGLAHAHRNGVIHRDLKPANLFVTPVPEVKVLDFGIAQVGDGEKLTRTGQGVPGSPAYYAPELINGEPASVASDIYAMGITLYEMLTGELPFKVNGQTEMQAALSLMYHHVHTPLPDVRAVKPDVPAELSALIGRAAAKKPGDRIPSAEAFTAELSRFKKSWSVASLNLGAPALPGQTPRPRSGPSRSMSPAKPESSRNVRRSPTPARVPDGPRTSGERKKAGRSETRFAIPSSDESLPARRTPTGVRKRPSRPAREIDSGSATSFAMPRPEDLEGEADDDQELTPTQQLAAQKQKGTRAPPAWVWAAAGAVLLLGGILGFRALDSTRSEKREAAKHAEEKPGEHREGAHAEAQPAGAPKPAPKPVPAEMVRFGAGLLKQGRAEYGDGPQLDTPEHPIAVQDFALQRTEVSIGEFAKFARAEGIPMPWPEAALSRLAPLPVAMVAQSVADKFCKWRFPRGRLPTESEWEYAARGEAGRRFPWGAEFKPECVNAMKGDNGTFEPVTARSCGATPEGLLGMAGNAWEWTSSPATAYPGSDVKPAPDLVVVRGGSYFQSDANELTTSVRRFAPPLANGYIGFRCAVDVE